MISRAAAADPPAALERSDGAPRAATLASRAAREHYQRGLEYYDAGEHARALREFERAYATSKNHRLLFNIGQILYEQHQLARARSTLDRYLSEGGPLIPPARRDDVARQLADLARKTAVLILHLDEPGTEVELQGQPHTALTRELHLIVDVGRVRVVARRADLAPVERSVWVDGGSTTHLSIAFAPHAAPGEGSRPSFSIGAATWTAAGALGVVAVSAGVATLLTSQHYEELRRTRTDTTPEHHRDLLDRQRERVEAMAMVTDGFALAALAAAGVALYFSLADSGESAAALVLKPGQVGATLAF
jgi:tetratricopeptide (TPR) repeat protein